jgi:hypothetical protein
MKKLLFAAPLFRQPYDGSGTFYRSSCLRHVTLWILICSAAMGTGPMAIADEALFFDTFYLAPRPRGDRGELRDVFANTSLNDFWVQFPGTNIARWKAGDGQDFGWQFSASSIDPYEPPEDALGGNGTITARGRPAALVAFTPPGYTLRRGRESSAAQPARQLGRGGFHLLGCPEQ